MKPIKVGEIKIELIWFDSMGAKSNSFLIKTPEIKILVDPGAAIMQSSFPLSPSEKYQLRNKALDKIIAAAQKADVIFISHYHYDHHTLPEEVSEIYKNKKLWIKNPNFCINYSQWKRARKFLGQLFLFLEGKELEDLFYYPEEIKFSSPEQDIPLALTKDYGDYQPRKNELLQRGKRWFKKMSRLWSKRLWVREFSGEKVEVKFADEHSFKSGSTRVRFTSPLFHGIEYDRLGWIVGLIVEHNQSKILYTSDLQGPIIEDYADWIIKENPDVLIVDGPATYLLGYMLNQINLERAITNVCSILQKIRPKIIIYDHHLPRDLRFKERMFKIYQTAEIEDQVLLTAAEWFGQEPLILTLKNAKLF
ncbi:MAG: MBL fold metallo-hydrolase [Candidatus Aminicenantia bacterium]